MMTMHEVKYIFMLLLIIIYNNNYSSEFNILSKSSLFPYQASIRWNHNSEHHCSATIVHKLFMLTAGHCVCSNVKYNKLHVVAGANSFSDHGQQISNISSAICHEDFNAENLRNDIALIKLRKKLKYSRRVQPLSLEPILVPADANLMIAVWGYKKKYTVLPKHFKLLHGNKIELSDCSTYFKSDMISPTNICTITEGPGPCIGDSGGPVLYNGELVGLISFGKKCDIPTFPNVHTNVSKYIDWINMQILLETL